jgi:hypothetical protein
VPAEEKPIEIGIAEKLGCRSIACAGEGSVTTPLPTVNCDYRKSGR